MSSIAETTIEELMLDVPRGKAWDFQRAQTPHQARWQDPKLIKESALLTYDPTNPQGKLLIGAQGDKLIGIDDNRHAMTIAGSRAGKSVMLVSNLLFYDGSVVCNDVKGELTEVTALTRAGLGQRVYVLDPFHIIRGKAKKFRASFNPLKILTLDNFTIVEDALSITEGLVIRSGNETDPHWNEASSDFIMGIILYVAVSDDVKDEDRNLATVRTCINMALSTNAETGRLVLPSRILSSCRRIAKEGHEDVADAIEGAIRGFYEKEGDERASVLSTAKRHTQFLDYRSIKQIVKGSDFDLADLKKDPKGVSIYLCLPATRMEMCNRWLRVFINQFLIAMENEKPKPKAPVLLCLDEFPVLGFMSQLQSAAGQIASFDVKLWIILQDWGQGKALYGDRFESFAANAGILQAFGNVDLTTTEYLSKRLGKTVVEMARRGEASPDQRQKGLSGQNLSSDTFDLLSPDEIARLFSRADPFKRELVFWAGYHPMILQRVEYFDPESPLYQRG